MANLTAAVDAAARAWFDRDQAKRMDATRFNDQGRPWTFDDLTPLDQHALRTLVLPIVTAAFSTLDEADTQ